MRSLLWGLSVLTTAGCAAREAAPPPMPMTQATRADLRGVSIFARDFRLEGAEGVTPEAREILHHRVLDYLEAHTALSDIYFDHEGELGEPSLLMDIEVTVETTTYRTYILDLLAMAPPIFGLFTPCWGEVAVEVRLTVSDRWDAPVVSLSDRGTAQFSALAYAWFRTRYIEEALQQAYDASFVGLATQLARAAPRLASEARRSTPVDVVASNPARTNPQLDYRADYGEEPPGFGLVTEAPDEDLDGWYGVARMLGGVEVAGIVGIAEVSSSVTDDRGGVEVASGDAQHLGWRVSLYDAPDTTGFFWYPMLGFLSQAISIADFREQLPRVEVPGATEIGAVCSDPESGARVECQAPNVYQLQMNSGFLGLRAGYDLVFGWPDVQFFVAAGAGVNLVEYRSLDVRLSAYQARAEGFSVLRSVSAGLDVGVVFRPAHVALRVIADYDAYLRFGYREPLEFRGPPEYDAEEQRYRRRRVLVDDARLGTFNLQIATAFVF